MPFDLPTAAAKKATRRPATKKKASKPGPLDVLQQMVGPVASKPTPVAKATHKAVARAQVRAQRQQLTHSGPARVAGVKATGNEVQIKARRSAGDVVRAAVAPAKRAAESIDRQVNELVQPGGGRGGVFAAPARPKSEQVKSSSPNPRTQAALGGVRRARVVSAGIGSLPTVPVRATVDVLKATAEDPVGVGAGTAKGLRDAAIGLAPATAKIVKETAEGTVHGDPLRGVKGAGKDYASDLARRYGPLLKGDDKSFIDRIKKEGAAAELLDATTVVAPAKGALSRRLEAAAKTGVLGERAKTIVEAPRVARRVSGGKGPEAVREQAAPEGYFAKARAKKKDARTFAAQQRELRKVDDPARARREDSPVRGGARGEADAVIREATKLGQVVPSRAALPGVRRDAAGRVVKSRPLEARRAVSRRRLEREQQLAYARDKGRAQIAQRSETTQDVVRPLNRSQAQLSRSERRAYKLAVQTGARTPAALAKVAEQRIRSITAERAREGAKVVRGHDELPALRKIVEAPEQHMTPRLAAAADLAARTSRDVAQRSTEHGLPEERAVIGAVAAQAQHLGLERGGRPIREAELAARVEVRRAKRRRASARAKERAAIERSARVRGRTEIHVERAERIRDGEIARTERAIEMHERSAANHSRRAAAAKTPEVRARHASAATAARARAVAAQDRLKALKAGRETSPRRSLGKLERSRGRLQDFELAAKSADEAVARAQVRAAELRRQRQRGARFEPGTKESHDAFAARVHAEAAKHGLAPGAYFPSVAKDRPIFSAFATGGSTAVKRDRARTGATFAIGGEANRPDLLQQSLANTIKRRHNWELVDRTQRAHAFPWSRGTKDGGMRLPALRDAMAREGVDEASVGFWNPEIFRRELDELEGAGDETTAANIGEDALAEATKRASDVRGPFANSGGWLAVPKALHEEIHADTRPSSAAARAWDISKAWQSRILLGTSPPWLLFQVVSNGVLAGLGGVKPHDFIAAQRWWKGLSEDERRAVDPYIGAGAFHDSITQTHMGAATDSDLVNAYRAMKSSSFWHAPRKPLRGRAVRDLNPLDVLFKGDKAQNDFFRRAVLYSAAKKEAYRRMGENVGAMQRLHDQLVPKMLGGADPGAKMSELIRDQGKLEELANHVNEFMGDYLTYSAKERRTIGRAAMFYGYLRFSLRFTFYTMPTRHPAMTALALNLGRLQEDELRKLLGGTSLPWALGKFEYASGGKLKSIDVSRANPFVNQLTEVDLSGGPFAAVSSTALGMAPPIVVALADQAYGASSFTHKGWKVNGETQPRSWADYTGGQRARIFGENMAQLVGYYRALGTASSDGQPQGADSSLLLGRRPTVYKDPAIRASIAATAAARPGFVGRLAQQELPFLPRTSNDAQIANRAGAPAVAAGPQTPQARAQADLARAQIAAARAAAASPGAQQAQLSIARAQIAAAKGGG